MQEGRVEFRNFGVFEVKRRPSRPGRNPRTGESFTVPDRWVVAFKPGKEMVDRVQGYVAKADRAEVFDTVNLPPNQFPDSQSNKP